MTHAEMQEWLNRFAADYQELMAENKALRAEIQGLTWLLDRKAPGTKDQAPVKPQAPVTNGPSGIEAEVCADITSRQAIGLRKYGVSVEAAPLPLREWLTHAYQECLDQAIYLKRAIREEEAPTNRTKDTNSETGWQPLPSEIAARD